MCNKYGSGIGKTRNDNTGDEILNNSVIKISNRQISCCSVVIGVIPFVDLIIIYRKRKLCSRRHKRQH